MSLLDDYDILEEDSGLGISKHFLDNLNKNDQPALLQAWYDLFNEKFRMLPNHIKIIYLNTMLEYFPKYRIGHNTYKVGTSFVFPQQINDYILGSVRWRIKDYVTEYLMTDNRFIKDTIHLINMTLLWPQENMTWALNNKIYTEPYYIHNTPYPDEQTVRIETKYHEILYHLKNIIDIKTKRGELE
jgi:hypothetical protein